MKRTFLMGVDAGGGSGRCLLVNVASGEVFSAKRVWSHLPAIQAGGMAFDLDLDSIWNMLGEVCHEAMKQAGISPDEVAGIAITSMRHSTILLDKKGNTLFAVPNRDARVTDAISELAERGGEFQQISGRWPIPCFTGVRLKWLAENTPQELARASVFLSLGEWITYRLCGHTASDPSHAGETMLYDLHKRDWSWELIRSLGLPKNIFPKIENTGARLGKLTSEAAKHLGLKSGIPVAVGGADTQCGLLGADAIKPGQLGIVAGTTAPMQLVLDSLVIDHQAHLWTGRHVLADQYVMEGIAGSLGESLEWIARLLYADSPRPVARLDAEATQSPPGAAGLFSTFGTQMFDGSNLSLPVGFLALSHMIAGGDPYRRKHLARAILEGMAYAIRANAEQMRRVSGIQQPDYILTGGMSRSAFWRQMVADVLDRPITIACLPETSALGAAICAGTSAGVFRNLAEGSAALKGAPQCAHPHPGAVEIYNDNYAEWLQFLTAEGEGKAAAGSILFKGLASSHVQTMKKDATAFRPRMLVTAPMDESALARLRRLGEVTYQNYRGTYNVLIGDELVEAMKDRHMLITEVDVVDADALSKLPDLRLLAACRGNAVNVDTDACTAFGVPLINAPGRNADAVADLTLAFMLMLARKLAPAVQFLRAPETEAGDLARLGAAHHQFQGIELWHKTIGIIGMGATGRGVIRRVLAFGARVLVFDPYITPEQITLAGAECASLETLLKESDFISLHAAVTPETTDMLGRREFGMMKPGAFLINTARAALTEEAALIHALRSGPLAGAAIDVFSSEPPAPNDPLLLLPNVIVTPHIAGNTTDVSAHQGEIVADELERILHGERPHFLVNPETFESFSWTKPRPIPSAKTIAQLRARGNPAVRDLDATKRTDANISQRWALEGRMSNAFEAAPMTKKESPAMNQITTLETILCEFLTCSEKDRALLAFAASRVFVMHYVLTDANLEFHMIFENGNVKAGMSVPAGKPDLILKMKADIFDGMMTGKINAMGAAMSGKMKFSGDTGKAMQMQRIQKDIMRLYSEARKKIGDPGDLTNLISGQLSLGSHPPSAIREQAPIVSEVPGTVQTRAVIQSGDERDELIVTVNELYEKNLITATGGNLSARVAGRSNELWITPSAIFKGRLTAETMVRINMDGEALEEGAATPSSERWVHTEILKVRPDLNSVIHTHAPWATLLALTGTPFLPISTEAAFLGDIPCVPFIMPGTRELAVAVAKAMGEKGSVVLMQNHGLVVAGSSLRRAASTTEVVERCSELILRCLTLGKQPPILPDEAVSSLREIGQMMA